MDSLQSAIEKARREREGQIGQTPSPDSTDAAGAVPSAPESSQPEQASTTSSDGADRPSRDNHELPSPENVCYTHTRTVALDPDALARNRVIAGSVSDPRVEPYRQLRSLVLGKMKLNSWRTLAITSAHEDAGKTLTAVNLAISISQEISQTVMLVDLDLRSPQVNKTLAVDIEKGLVEHLLDNEPLENILFNPDMPRLVVLPSTPQGQNSSEVLSSPYMANFLDDIKNRYPDRFIIFDLPPLLRNDDAMVFVPKADACLLVVEDGMTRPDEIERSLQLLGQANLLGTVLNKAQE